MDAIKAQINYRKKVLGQNFAAKSCNFSEAGKSFLLHEMSQRLKAIASFKIVTRKPNGLVRITEKNKFSTGEF